MAIRFFRKVDQRWSPRGAPLGRFGMYFATVRGDSRMPSSSNSSLVGNSLLAAQRILGRHPTDQHPKR